MGSCNSVKFGDCHRGRHKMSRRLKDRKGCLQCKVQPNSIVYCWIMFDIVSNFTYLSLLFEFTSEMYENLMDLEISPQCWRDHSRVPTCLSRFSHPISSLTTLCLGRIISSLLSFPPLTLSFKSLVSSVRG